MPLTFLTQILLDFLHLPPIDGDGKGTEETAEAVLARTAISLRELEEKMMEMMKKKRMGEEDEDEKKMMGRKKNEEEEEVNMLWRRARILAEVPKISHWLKPTECTRKTLNFRT